MITSEDIHRLMKLKATDKEAFYKLLNEMAHSKPVDILLSYKKFKEYSANV
ncbi:hypothetical protein [Methanooceanicella nereidis]|uniref:hypothetical protein n=1 Tax=Methanooceanicella nereidis TaxID=2052831 RepID=UPI001E52787F|nr:hypothetical protein [Methanocella sp. CWC-04]